MRWKSRAAMITVGIAAALTVAAPPTNATEPTLIAGLTAGDRTTIPADFAKVMGYEPVEGRLADGTVRLINPAGSCSVPGEGRPFDFAVACQAHDFGYDLLRYGRRTGKPLPASARGDIDQLLTEDLHTQCQADTIPAQCDATVAVFRAAVGFNSWRQVSGPPVNESGLPRTAGLVLLGAVGLLALVRARRWRRTGVATGSARRGYRRLSADPAV